MEHLIIILVFVLLIVLFAADTVQEWSLDFSDDLLLFVRYCVAQWLELLILTTVLYI